MRNTLWFKHGSRPVPVSRCRPTAWLRLGLALLPVLPFAAPADDAAAGLPAQYFELAGLYDALSFSPGPLQTFESPDAERYRDLTVAMHAGKVRLGLLDEYDTTYGTQPNERRQAKINVHKRLVAEREVYLGLLALQYGADYFTDDNLLQDDPDAGSRRYVTVQSFSPRGYVGALAYNLYREPFFKVAFCTDKPACWEPAYRSLQQMGVRAQTSLAGRWGGGRDEFAARAAVETFIEQDLQPLLDWSAALPTEVAIVDRVLLTEYDFGRSGFVFDIVIPQGGGVRATELGYAYYESDDAAVKVLAPGAFSTKALLPMAAGAAEALIEELKATPGNDLLYFVVNGRINNVAMNETRYRSNKFSLLYELTSPEIAFYKDSALTEPLGTVTLQPTLGE